ncbi:TetR/AcrR family transcriptional regulator [Streptomyces sp900105755]|uniref:TetR/AcrR family transcriptional regulator n=1 Tax=Streptomyces sp. 900105755 TaxID=3154389 RepID=UPI0033249662
MSGPSAEETGAVLRRTPQQARSKARLARVLKAAERVLIAEGVPALTTTRVAADAGVSVGSLYQYLPDRDAIIDALAATYFAQLEGVMEEFVRSAATERWADPVGVLIDTYAGLYRTEQGFRALWFGSGLTDRTRAADREHKRRMADGVRRVLVALGIAGDTEGLGHACHAAVLAADALAQEAFRRDTEGDAALLDEAKVMLRGYLTALAGRHGRQEGRQEGGAVGDAPLSGPVPRPAGRPGSAP